MNSRNSDIGSMKGVCEWLPVPPDTHTTQYVGDVVGAVILAVVIAKIDVLKVCVSARLLHPIHVRPSV